MSKYWQYLEVLLSYKKGQSEMKFIDTVSHIILLNELDTRNNTIQGTIFELLHPFNFSYKLLGFSPQQYATEYNKFFKTKKSKFMDDISYPFIDQLRKGLKTGLNLSNYKDALAYIQGVLWEAYGFRNSDLHSGILCYATKRRLEFTLPYLIARFRWILFKEVEKNRNIPFNRIVISLRERGEKLVRK